MNIAEVLLRQVAELGDSPAIIDVHRGKRRSFSFRDLDRATAALASQFRDAGLLTGDGVLLLHPVAAELYLVLIALFRIGCVAVFLDPSAGPEHIERCCTIFPPKAFFGSAEAQLLRWKVPALRRVPQSFCSAWFPGSQKLSFGAAENVEREITSLPADAPALVTFTSGSTAQPKAASRTHEFLLAQHRALAVSLELRSGTRDLTTLPIFVLANLASGVTSVLPDADLRSPGNIAAGPVLSQIQREAIQTTAASPAFISRLLDGCQRTATAMAHLQKIYIGGAPVFPGLLRRTKHFCPDAEIMSVYGSTEAEPMAEIALSDISQADFEAMERGKGLLAGRPVEYLSLRVIRDQWGTPIPPLDHTTFDGEIVPVNEPGEIVVSGDHVSPGYLNAGSAAETKFEVDGVRWHRTGDLGYLDAHGRLWLLGRCSGKVHDERGTLYPFAVECAVMQNPAIHRAALAMVDGRRVLAIETKERLTADVILRSLAWAKLDQVLFLDRIPVDKRHNAKIDYPALHRKLKNPKAS
jgi:acyl-CoA synthetase (AMP-forming)/AMP-acid ligase II